MKRNRGMTPYYLDRESCESYEISHTLELQKSPVAKGSASRYISLIPSSMVTGETVELDKDSPADMVYDLILEKAYEELSLDPELAYVIEYMERGLNYDNTKMEYELFIAQEEEIRSLFGECAKRYHYIDYIIPASTVFDALYKKNILEKNSSHFFIYIGQKDAFVSIYSDGALVYQKNIALNLARVLEIFNDYSPSELDIEEFAKLMSGELEDEDGIYENAISSLYNEIGPMLEEIISHLKRLYSINMISAIYLDGDIRMREDIHAFLKEYLLVECRPFEFGYNLPKGSYRPHLETLALLLLGEYVKGKKADINFTLYNRPAPLLQRSSGKLLAYTLGAALLALLYPAINLGDYLLQRSALQETAKTLGTMNSQLAQLESSISAANGQKNEAESKLKSVQSDTGSYVSLLEQIKQRQGDYVEKIPLLVDIVSRVVRNGTLLKSIALDGGVIEGLAHSSSKDTKEALERVVELRKDIEIVVEAEESGHITSLVDDLGASGRYGVRVDSIAQNESVYEATLKVEIL